ncbi:MAG: protein kinase [Thermoanaerobaculaceae bacterium]|nr:protein kinase [Thermoanaerobaculaceae bacterium]MDI9621935.1 protein kinase [Acidobacteriota bacterium]NLH12251.1 protein kinase [Holophagae bacterium]HPW55651.1 protein kinase [Thermoanaerobaculaceae bacterium]
MGSVARGGKKSGKGAGAAGLSPVFSVFEQLEIGQPLDVSGELEYRGVAAEGCYGSILKVLHRPSNALRAVKAMHPSLLANDVSQRLFEEEFEKLAGVAGEFAVKVFDLGPIAVVGQDQPWWVMSLEWVEGRTLRDVVSGSRFSQQFSFERYVDRLAAEEDASGSGLTSDEALHFLEQAAHGVAELHRAGLCHLDVRLDHLLLAKSGSVRLIGFGLGAELRRAAQEALGVRWQTSPYAPPELLRGDWAALGPQSDVYQLALLAYELFKGTVCSPWVGYEELCESADFLPVSMDELVQDCLGDIDQRPADADAFLVRLRDVAAVLDENQRRSRTRPNRKAKEIWQRALAMAGRERPQWGYIAGMCQRLLEEKPHLLPFGKIPVKRVDELLGSAQTELAARRRAMLDELLTAQAWGEAAAFVERLGGEVATDEVDELKLNLELAQVAAHQEDPAARSLAHQRIMELLKQPRLSSAVRDRAAQALESLLAQGRTIEDSPGATLPPPVPASVTVAPPLEPMPGPPVAAAPQTEAAAPPIAVVTDLGLLAPVERFQVESARELTTWRVVVGPAVRFGRGSFEEFGNHLDLRPTRREAAENSITLALAQRLSRAGHMEFRVAPSGLEAFCMGTHGAAMDGKVLKRGERCELGDEGRCLLAQGAAEFVYKVWRGREGSPQAVEFAFTAGVGAGRHAVWVFSSLPIHLLVPSTAAKVLVVPTRQGWMVEARSEAVKLDEVELVRGTRHPWAAEAVLELPEGTRIVHG